MNKRPELDTKNPPGQIVNDWTEALPAWKPPRYLRDVIKAAQERSSEDLVPIPTPDAEKRLEAVLRALRALMAGEKGRGSQDGYWYVNLDKIVKENT